MRLLFFTLSLVLCSLFIVWKNTEAHPHKLGETNHGPSLETYQIELDFPTYHMIKNEKMSKVKIADKKQDYKNMIHKKPNKHKAIKKIQKPRKNENKK